MSQLSPAILIKWSAVDIVGSISTVLLTVFSLLLCTFVSLIQQQLSLADAHFSMTITISPVTLYLIYASVRAFFKKETLVYTRLDAKTSLIVKIFAYTLVLAWVTLEVLIYFWPNKLFSRGGCGKISMAAWIYYVVIMTFDRFFFPLVLTLPTVPIWFFIYTLRHWRDIRGEMKRHMGNLTRWKKFRWIQTFFRTIQFFFLSDW